MKKNPVSRRGFLKWGLTSSAAVIASSSLAQVCGESTPPQPEGPFYPITDQADKDWDLVHVKGNTTPAEGQQILVQGRVTDESCAPISKALVEIWQACHTGRYNHPGDPNTAAALDPHFQYWGRNLTDEDGRYQFLTIWPGQYPAGPDWIRPAHIHFKVHRRGFSELTTQMYFAGDPYNNEDRILSRLPKREQERVIIDFLPQENQLDPLVGQFDLTLTSI